MEYGDCMQISPALGTGGCFLEGSENRVLRGLSVFFPAFNEEANILPTLKEALRILPAVAEDYEVIVVDDGSRDRTRELAIRFAESNPAVRVVSHPRNLGYGAALSTGFKESKMEWVFFTDADRQFDLDELRSVVSYCGEYDAVLGYRKRRADRLYRRALAGAWGLTVNLALGVRLKDLDCAFKLIKKEYLDSLVFTCSGATISAELATKLKAKGCRWVEIPVSHYPRPAGRQTGARPDVLFKAVKELLVLKKRLAEEGVGR